MRRSSDNAALDFYALSNGSLNSAADGTGQSPRAWGGSAGLFVRTWYDQVGTRHATQHLVDTNQPEFFPHAYWTTGPVVRFRRLTRLSDNPPIHSLYFDGSLLVGAATYTVAATVAKVHRALLDSTDSASGVNNYFISGMSCTPPADNNANLHIGWATDSIIRLSTYGPFADTPSNVSYSFSGQPYGQVVLARSAPHMGKSIHVDGVAALPKAPNFVDTLSRWDHARLGEHCGGLAFSGDMTEVALYTTALNGDDVARLSACMAPPPPTPITCDDLRGTAVYSMRRRVASYLGPVIKVRAAWLRVSNN